jgi:hypothetical protein
MPRLSLLSRLSFFALRLTIIISPLLAVTEMASAHTPEEGRIYVSAGPFVYKTNFEAPNPNIKSAWLGGGGLFVEGDVNRHGGLEVGIMYMHKMFFRRELSDILAEKIKLLHITMGYRHWFSERFSGGLSFYSSYTMGDKEVIHSDFTPPDLYDTSARDTTEYGFDLSLQWEAWRHEVLTMVIDTRYSWSVTPKSREDSDHYGALVVLKHLIQEK